jgi:UPF0716 protein FxsA
MPRLALLLYPFLELFVLIELGGALGAGWTLLWLLLAALAGAALIRREGVSLLARLPELLARREPPAAEMLAALARVAAGVLLIIPGFVSDVAALVLLVSPLRQRVIAAWVRGAAPAGSARGRDRNEAAPRVIDGEARRVPDERGR